MDHRTILALLLGLILTGTAVAEGASPADSYPSGLGFSYSDLTGTGLNYRWLDSHGGWQIAGMLSNQSLFNGDSLYSVGVAKHFVLFSFVANSWFFSQFYWLGAASWRSYTTTEWTQQTKAKPVAEWDTYEWVALHPWHHTAVVGPGMGIEFGLFSHFSFNVEVGYKLGYDFAASTPSKAIIALPGFSALGLFRY